MSRVVHKFLVPFRSGAQLPVIPASQTASVVFAAMDPRSGQPAVWLEFDPAVRMGEGRRMVAFATGDEIPDGWVHRGSMVDGSFIWHVYEQVR